MIITVHCNPNPNPKQSNSCLTSLSRDQNSFLPITLQGSNFTLGVVHILRNQFLETDSESPLMTEVKMLPWRVMGKKLFWSRDRLVKHEFDCFGLGLGLGLWLGL